MSRKRRSRDDDGTGTAPYVDALDAGLWDYDIDADLLTCDAQWYDLLGARPGSIHKVEQFRPYIHADDAAQATTFDLAAVDQAIVDDRRYHVDFRIIRPNGTVRWWRSVACLLVDGETGHRRAIGWVMDVTGYSGAGAPESATLHGPTADPEPANDGGDEDALSAKETECLRWVSLGKTAWETAVITNRSPRTVEFHLLNAVKKLGATNKVHAVVIAIARGLI